MVCSWSDPVFLQELVKINGNITLSDGRVLAGGNTAEFLLNKVYIDYPVYMQDTYFAQVAVAGTVSNMFSNLDLTKPSKGSATDGKYVGSASSLLNVFV